MNRTDVAIVVNTCPKYFYLLDACFGLIRRYADECKWPIYLATEVATDPLIVAVTTKHRVQLLPLQKEDSDFLQSRAATMKMLPQQIQYVLPLQEDFLLERVIDAHMLTSAVQLLDKDRMVQESHEGVGDISDPKSIIVTRANEYMDPVSKDGAKAESSSKGVGGVAKK